MTIAQLVSSIRRVPRAATAWHSLGVLALFVTATAAGCSPSAGTAPTGGAPGTTAIACTTDADCTSGHYCGATKACTADCGAGTATCAAGLTCSSSGRCVPPTAVSTQDAGGTFFPSIVVKDAATPSVTQDGGACVADTRQGEVVPLDMFVIWDRSGSMDDQVNGGRKWDLVIAAFSAFLNDPQSAGISVGIQFFPLATGGGVPDNSNYSCNVADYGVAAVPIAPLNGNAAPILSSLGALVPAGKTPTRVALQGAIEYARTWATQNPSHKVVVVLQTDGDPNVCSSTVKAVSQVAADGLNPAAAQPPLPPGTPSLPTYVIGVGSSTSNLNQIAQSGGTTQALVVDTTQDTTQQFIDAMNTIRGSAQLPCDFLLPPPDKGQTVDPSRVNVTFTASGGAGVTTLLQASDQTQCDATAGGWYYDDPLAPTRVSLCPASCTQVKTDSAGRVQILLGCKTKPITVH